MSCRLSPVIILAIALLGLIQPLVSYRVAAQQLILGKTILVYNPSNETIEKYALLVTLNSSSVEDEVWQLLNCTEPNIVFIDESGQYLSYYIEYCNATAKELTVWIGLSLTQHTTKKITMLVGVDPGLAKTYHDPRKVFRLYEDFTSWSYSASGTGAYQEDLGNGWFLHVYAGSYNDADYTVSIGNGEFYVSIRDASAGDGHDRVSLIYTNYTASKLCLVWEALYSGLSINTGYIDRGMGAIFTTSIPQENTDVSIVAEFYFRNDAPYVNVYGTLYTIDVLVSPATAASTRITYMFCVTPSKLRVFYRFPNSGEFVKWVDMDANLSNTPLMPVIYATAWFGHGPFDAHVYRVMLFDYVVPEPVYLVLPGYAVETGPIGLRIYVEVYNPSNETIPWYAVPIDLGNLSWLLPTAEPFMTIVDEATNEQLYYAVVENRLYVNITNLEPYTTKRIRIDISYTPWQSTYNDPSKVFYIYDNFDILSNQWIIYRDATGGTVSTENSILEIDSEKQNYIILYSIKSITTQMNYIISAKANPLSTYTNINFLIITGRINENHVIVYWAAAAADYHGLYVHQINTTSFTLLASTADTMPENTWYYVDIIVDVETGTVNVYVNGSLKISYSYGSPLELFTGIGVVYAHSLFDYIIARPYVEPEPYGVMVSYNVVTTKPVLVKLPECAFCKGYLDAIIIINASCATINTSNVNYTVSDGSVILNSTDEGWAILAWSVSLPYRLGVNVTVSVETNASIVTISVEAVDIYSANGSVLTLDHIMLNGSLRIIANITLGANETIVVSRVVVDGAFLLPCSAVANLNYPTMSKAVLEVYFNVTVIADGTGNITIYAPLFMADAAIHVPWSANVTTSILNDTTIIVTIVPASNGTLTLAYQTLDVADKETKIVSHGVQVYRVIAGDKFVVVTPVPANITVTCNGTSIVAANTTFVEIDAPLEPGLCTVTVVLAVLNATAVFLGHSEVTIPVTYGTVKVNITVDLPVTPAVEIVPPFLLPKKFEAHSVEVHVPAGTTHIDVELLGIKACKTIVNITSANPVVVVTPKCNVVKPVTKGYDGQARYIVWSVGSNLTVEDIGMPAGASLTFNIEASKNTIWKVAILWPDFRPPAVNVEANSSVTWWWSGNTLYISGFAASTVTINVTELWPINVEALAATGRLVEHLELSLPSLVKPGNYTVVFPERTNEGFMLREIVVVFANGTKIVLSTSSVNITVPSVNAVYAVYRVPTRVESVELARVEWAWMPLEGETVLVYIRGRLVDYFGEPVANARLVLRLSSNSQVFETEAVTDSGGYFEVGPLRLIAGKQYRLAVSYAGSDVYVGTTYSTTVVPEAAAAQPPVFGLPPDLLAAITTMVLAATTVAAGVRALRAVRRAGTTRQG